MKLSIFCVILLICATWVIYQQKQRLAEFSAKVEALQNENAELLKKIKVPIPAASPAGTPTGAWMYKNGADSLNAHAHK